MSTSARPGWSASLDLQFSSVAQTTRLTGRAHVGPLQIQKILYPEGPDLAHGIVLHPPGGIAGGDSLTVNISLSPGSAALITTPGAAKWYRANGREASQDVSLSVGEGARLEYFVQENIVFNEAVGASRMRVDLAPGAIFAGWEITCLGRPAGDQPWLSGAWRQSMMITTAGRPVFQERLHLLPDTGLRHATIGLAGASVQGTFVVVAGKIPPELLAACQSLVSSARGGCGVSALPNVFTARYLGDCTEEARRFFEQVWAVLRPWYAQRKAVRPRIWST